MEEIAISKFKATCLAVLERVRKTGKPVVVTRFGQPIAQISPPEVAKNIKLGGGAGTMARALVMLRQILRQLDPRRQDGRYRIGSGGGASPTLQSA